VVVDRESRHDERSELQIQPERFLHEVGTPELEQEMARITGPERTFELFPDIDAGYDLQPFVLGCFEQVDDHSIEVRL
jgi:hypothetical protein